MGSAGNREKPADHAVMIHVHDQHSADACALAHRIPPDVLTQGIPIDEADRAKAHTLSGSFDRWLDALVSGPVYRTRVAPAPPAEPGVYLFANGSRVMHVGRTKNLQERRRSQTSPSGDRFVATFAFLMARHQAAESHSDLPNGRGQLAIDDRFIPFFIQAKAEVRAMDFRCVVIADHAQQAVFEVFASIALNSPYNFWETH
jgi:hypothetical protein